MNDAALVDVRLLDLTHYIAGPNCTNLLADYGADVITVQRPDGGDLAPRYGPFLYDAPHPEKSAPFLHITTNKRGLTLNLKTAVGNNLCKALVQEVDLLVENFRPWVMPSLGLSYDQLAVINPRLVMTSISTKYAERQAALSMFTMTATSRETPA